MLRYEKDKGETVQIRKTQKATMDRESIQISISNSNKNPVNPIPYLIITVLTAQAHINFPTIPMIVSKWNFTALFSSVSYEEGRITRNQKLFQLPMKTLSQQHERLLSTAPMAIVKISR